MGIAEDQISLNWHGQIFKGTKLWVVLKIRFEKMINDYTELVYSFVPQPLILNHSSVVD